MADERHDRSNDFRSRGERSWRGSSDRRGFGRRDEQGGRRSSDGYHSRNRRFDDGESRRDGGFQRDGGFRRDGESRRGSGQWQQRDNDRDFKRGSFNRSDSDRDRHGEGRGLRERDDRRGGRSDRFDRDGRKRFNRRGDGKGRNWSDRGDRNDRHDHSERGSRFDRNDRGDRRRDDRSRSRHDRGNNQRGDANYASTEEYVSPHGDEPTIPAGVSASELDSEALRSLKTLSGANHDIVARHLVMAGQLIDLDPEQAYEHARAAAKRAGRVDTVREAAALTAYASGRYEEALREVRAVRRMRGDQSLRAVEADCERGLGHPERAVDIIDKTDTAALDLGEQVELVLVSSGARADLGQNEVGLVLVDDALAALPEDADTEYVRRLMSVKADRLRELGRDEEATQVEESMPPEIEDPDIVDIEMIADADVTKRGSTLHGTDEPLSSLFDTVLLDLDGVAWMGSDPIEHAAPSVVAARENGIKTVFVTNNASRPPQAVAEKLNSMGFEADESMIMTSAMDVAAIMSDELDDGAKVFMVGGPGLREALEKAGFTLVERASDQPDAVVMGLDRTVGWEQMSQAAYAIQAGARFFASNMDSTLPTEEGFALGNGSLVTAVEHATKQRATAAGKPTPGIYQRGANLVEAHNPLSVGDRLETDIAGAVSAGYPALHVLTGVHQAADVIRARKGQRPTYLALDMRGLNEAHPHPKHHKDNTWTCGYSQVASVTKWGTLRLDGIELTEPTTVTLDSYRALAAAAWAVESDEPVRCPELTVVPNDDPAGIVTPPEPQDEPEDEAENPEVSDAIDAELAEDTRPDSEVEEEALSTDNPIPAFLPGEEELEALLREGADDETGVKTAESEDDAAAADSAQDVSQDSASE